MGEQEWCAEAQGGREEGTRGIGARPKIKLVKAKQDKRVKTEYYDENRNNLLNAELSCCRPPPKIRLENNQNDNKLQHRLDRPLRDALNLTYNTTFRHEAREAASFSTGKSKLNQLTRSYANLKTKIGAGKLVKQMEETESELPRNGSSRCQPFHKGYEAVLNARSCLPASKIKPSCFKSETANFNRR